MFCSTKNFGWDFSLAYYEGDKIPLNWYRLCSMSCLLRFPTTLASNLFGTIFLHKHTARSQWHHCATSRSLSHRTQKRQSPERAWKRVHAGRCDADVGGVEHHLAFSEINTSTWSVPLIRDRFGSSDTYFVTS